MTYQWIPYTPAHAPVVEFFLDDIARTLTGCDEGWQAYYNYWANDPDTVLGENFWAQVISLCDRPIAVIAMGLNDGILTVSEFIVAPNARGQGHGTAILRELITHGETVIGKPFNSALAVIYPNNMASKRAFEKAGFVFESAHPDGDAWYYIYKTKGE